MRSEKELEQLHARASNNDAEILHSDTCSCFFCRQTYNARDVSDWVSDERGISAICPICGMDAVIGDRHEGRLDHDTLRELNLLYYGENFMEEHPQAAEIYCRRYQAGEISRKAQNETLYVRYLTLLADKGYPEAAMALGRLYAFGGEFTPADVELAFSCFTLPCLRYHGDALGNVGDLLCSGAMKKTDPEGALKCYVRGMALGSLYSYFRYADCYLNGSNGVEQDIGFAFACYSFIWEESYRRFVRTAGEDANVFGELCARLSHCYENGLGVEANDWDALRFTLLSLLGFRKEMEGSVLRPESSPEVIEVMNRLKRLSDARNLTANAPVFDSETLEESILNDQGFLTFDNLISVSVNHYDEEDHSLDFSTTSSSPLLIMDPSNLFCDFVPGTIRWSFADVANASYQEKMDFSSVSWDEERNRWVFADDNEDPVLVVDFYPENSESDTPPERKA